MTEDQRKLTDKERILMAIIGRIIPGLGHSFGADKSEYFSSGWSKEPKIGDLVIAGTSYTPNKFTVGFVHGLLPEGAVIREIGSDWLCNYHNECFHVINKEKLGYEILEGTEYKTYTKVLKAFREAVYWTRFGGIEFDDNICTVKARKVFSSDMLFKFTFKYGSKTTIKEIVEILDENQKKYDNDHAKSDTLAPRPGERLGRGTPLPKATEEYSYMNEQETIAILTELRGDAKTDRIRRAYDNAINAVGARIASKAMTKDDLLDLLEPTLLKRIPNSAGLRADITEDLLMFFTSSSNDGGRLGRGTPLPKGAEHRE